MSILKVTTIQNGAGTEVYTTKAWVNFNGTGVVAVRASGNVSSSITDNNTGDYTVNFTAAMTDANFAVAAHSNFSATVGGLNWSPSVYNLAVGSVRINTGPTGSTAQTLTDNALISVIVLR